MPAPLALRLRPALVGVALLLSGCADEAAPLPVAAAPASASAPAPAADETVRASGAPGEGEVSGDAGVADAPDGVDAAGATEVDGSRERAGLFGGREEQAAAGGYRIHGAAGALKLTLDAAFRSDEGPDLHVVLSPVAADAATGSNAMDGGKSLVVARLDGFTGEQTFDLPAGVDLGLYRSVLIQCVKHSHLFAAAELTP